MLNWKSLLVLTIAIIAVPVADESFADEAPQGLPQAAAIPLGLPPFTPTSGLSDSGSMTQLGQQLFFDQRLSLDGTVSCASCHAPNRAFTDGRATSIGVLNQALTRNAPSLLNVRYRMSLFWDGRVSDLTSQARLPLTSAVEHGLKSESEVVRIVQNDPVYVFLAASIVGTLDRPITIELISRAIASYEKTLLAGDSPFDKFIYGNHYTALSESAQRGLSLFKGRAGCASCHTIETRSALFSDEQYHVSPVGLPPAVTDNLPSLSRLVVDASRNQGELNKLIITYPKIAVLGRFAVTLDPSDIGKFKTPSLRNVAITAPYMHDGSVTTLEKAIELELYRRGDALKYPIILTVEERKDLLAFLSSLTSPAAD